MVKELVNGARVLASTQMHVSFFPALGGSIHYVINSLLLKVDDV